MLDHHRGLVSGVNVASPPLGSTFGPFCWPIGPLPFTLPAMHITDTPGRNAAPTDLAPVESVAGAFDSGLLLLCDHASPALPEPYGTLGLTKDHFGRHIAYDIGAAAVTRRLAALLGAPALMTTYSRLLIDPNRGADDPTLVMRISDRATIPGNAAIDEAGIDSRRRQFWQPYRDAIDAQIDAMCMVGPPPALVAIHSFTPVWRGWPRPWHVAALWDCDDRLARPFIDTLRAEPDLVVGDNEPYDGALEGDTMFDHGTLRGLAHMLVEIRQDLIADAAGAEAWADRLAGPLARCLTHPDTHIIRHYGSRAVSAQRLSMLRETRS